MCFYSVTSSLMYIFLNYRSGTSTPNTSSIHENMIGKSVQFLTDEEDELRDSDSNDED